jgi:hypothetical protein
MFFLLINPQWLGIWFANVAIAPTYIMYKIRLETKKSGMTNLVVNITNIVTHYMQLLYLFYVLN